MLGTPTLIYLASRYGRREELCAYRDQIESLNGIVCTSTWLKGEENKCPGSRARYAQIDLDDVRRSDILIHFTEPYGTMHKGGGRHCEMGYALALGIAVWLVGEREHIFCELPEIKVFRDWVDCFEQLKRESEDKQ